MGSPVVRRPVEFHAMEFVEFIKTPKVDNVTLHRPFFPPIEGTLCLTGHHLILSSRKTNSEELWLLHTNIDTIEKKFIGSMGHLTIKCKNFMIIQLAINGMEECLNIASSIEMLSNLDSVTLTYPFFYRPMSDIFEDGWQAFLPESEFARVTSDNWRLSQVNKNFQVCPTYPQTVVVPKGIDDDCIMQAAAFRQGGRFPVLSYRHRSNGTVILRSGQPLSGPNGKRCKEDERLLNAALGIGKRGYIIDTRSYNSAVNSRSKGGGFELEAHYPQWRRVHKPLERFSNLQEGLTKLMEACNKNTNSMDKWLGNLGSSSWLSNVKEVLTTACLVAQCVDRENSSVLVHGSEGLDSTLQITSLAQIILNPDCRTLRGFEALIEREWTQAGHPFASRCAKSCYAGSKLKCTGPVFLLFLDCVWQITQQFQCSFEFNELFLILVFENAYASQFGTFLCNNEHERRVLKLSEKTQSLWLERNHRAPYLALAAALTVPEGVGPWCRLIASSILQIGTYVNRPKMLELYINPLYQPNSSVIWPSVAPQSLMLWSGLFLRWDMDKSVNDSTDNEIRKIQKNDKQLKMRALQLRQQLAELQKLALEKGLISE